MRDPVRMLRRLEVHHLAVIDRLTVEFESGLNLITGETGAGKSVLIEALDLLLGGRASADLVRTGEQHATVQAILEDAHGRETLVRRELSLAGRSRAYIDDTLVTTAALRDFVRQHVELHGQHEQQSLLDPAGHGRILDATLQQDELLTNVAQAYDGWRAASTTLQRATLDSREKRARIDVARFQLDEITRVAPLPDEDDLLANEHRILADADRLQRLAQEAYASLYEGEHSALSALGHTWKRLADLASLDTTFTAYLEQRDTIKTALEDLAYALRDAVGRLESPEQRLQVVEERLAALERLKRKYGPLLNDVLEARDTFARELQDLELTDDQLAALTSEETRRMAEFLAAAERLSAARLAAGQSLSRALARTLGDLAMPNAVVDVRLTRLDAPEAWSERGFDQIEFYLSANPGEELRPLARIASGGELSRVMLALHSLVGSQDGARTMVFDEVDAGIGGSAADAVGARLSALARQHQVICVTHLAQIASRPGAHFRVSKYVREGRTWSHLERLDGEGRTAEVGRMIGGALTTPQVLASARELLARGESESETKTKGESVNLPRRSGKAGGK